MIIVGVCETSGQPMKLGSLLDRMNSVYIFAKLMSIIVFCKLMKYLEVCECSAIGQIQYARDFKTLLD